MTHPTNRMLRPLALAATALLCLSPAFAADPNLRIPDFSHLQQKATDSTDITISAPLLKLAAAFAGADENSSDEDAQALSILRDIASVRVRNYEFDSDGAYSKADVDAVRRQLSAPGWTPLVQAHKRDQKEDVDVYVCTDGKKVLGLAVIASDLRSFTIVNVIGDIDIDKFAKLEGQFGIPRTVAR
jgi:hypothetical protein